MQVAEFLNSNSTDLNPTRGNASSSASDDSGVFRRHFDEASQDHGAVQKNTTNASPNSPAQPDHPSHSAHGGSYGARQNWSAGDESLSGDYALAGVAGDAAIERVSLVLDVPEDAIDDIAQAEMSNGDLAEGGFFFDGFFPHVSPLPAAQKQVGPSITSEPSLQSAQYSMASVLTSNSKLQLQQSTINTEAQRLGETGTAQGTEALLNSNSLVQNNKQMQATEQFNVEKSVSLGTFDLVSEEALAKSDKTQTHNSFGLSSALNAPNSAASTNPENARFTVSVQFGKPTWNENLAGKVAQMAAQNLNFAEIQLDPPELGPLQVRVQVNQDQASVVFTAASAQVREALEQANPKLREMFEAEGLDLVDVDVSDQGQQETEDELDSEVAAHDPSSEETPDSLVGDGAEPVVKTELNLGVDEVV